MQCVCVWKCRLWQHLLFLPLPFRQKQSVQPIVCILPTTGNQYQPIHSHLRMPLWALAALSDKGGKKKKLDWQWPDLNIVLSGCSQHPLRGYIFPSEIIASVLLWMFFRSEHRAVWSSWTWVICSKGGPHFGKLFLGRCTIIANMSTVHIVSYLKEALMLIGPKFSCWCSSEISPVMKEKKDPNRRQNHQFYVRLSKRVSRSRLPDSQVGSKCSY